jgi:PAS domain S-box-containing protein
MNIIFSIVILAAVQISTLYLLLRKTIIHPLKAIENFAAGISSMTAILPDPPKGLFFGELRHLTDSIEDMVEALHTSEQSYRSIFENSLEGIYQSTLDGRFIKANPALADILGYSSVKELLDTITRLDQQLYIHSGRRKELLEIIETQGAAVGQEVAFRHRDGHTLHCLVSMYVIHNNRGEIEYLEGSLIDISERKKAEEQLASLNQRLEGLVEQRTGELNRRNAELIASEERYRTLVETMQEGILAIDEDGRLTYVNKQMSTLLGMVPDELIGRECTSIVEANEKDVFKEKITQANDQSTSKFEMNFVRSDGHIVSTLVTPTALYDGDGHFRGSFAVITDITNLKQLQSQLLHAQKLESIGQLAAGIAHEINTPTQYVANNARFLDDAFKELVEVFAAYESLFDAIKKGIPLSTALEEVEMKREDHQLGSLFEEIPGAFQDTFEGLERISSIVGSVKRFAHPG